MFVNFHSNVNDRRRLKLTLIRTLTMKVKNKENKAVLMKGNLYPQQRQTEWAKCQEVRPEPQPSDLFKVHENSKLQSMGMILTLTLQVLETISAFVPVLGTCTAKFCWSDRRKSALHSWVRMSYGKSDQMLGPSHGLDRLVN